MRLETQRLLIREFQRDDLEQLSLILASPYVMRFSATGCLSVSQTQAKIESFLASYAKYGFGKWAVILKHSDELIGYAGIAVESIDNQEETELGYRFDEKFWGRGLATEAASAILNYGLKKLKLPYLLGIAEPANTASINVLKKIGMKYQKDTVLQGIQMEVYRGER